MTFVRRLMVFATAFILGLILVPTAFALASEHDTTPVGPSTEAETSLFTLTPYTVNVLVGLVIPALVAYFSKRSTKPIVKKAATAFLSGVGGLIAVGITDGGGSVFTESGVKSAALTFAMAIVSYFGLLRNSRTEEVLQDAGPIRDEPAERAA